MGGRGASSGRSANGRDYGTEYTTVFQSGNIKFIKKLDRKFEAPLETRTRGRVYVTVGGDRLLAIHYYSAENKREKTIDLTHAHKGMQPHVHHGYEHNEYDGPKGGTGLSPKERQMVARVEEIWYGRTHKKV